MGRVATDLRDTQESARRLRFEPGGGVTGTDVQTAIQQVAAIAFNPPSPTPIVVAANAYVVQPTDRIIEVNFAGNVAITLGSTSARGGLDLEIKDISGGLIAGPFTITITPDASDVNGIDGQATAQIVTDFGAIHLRPVAGELAWRVGA